LALKMETYVFAQYTGGPPLAISIDGAQMLALENTGGTTILVGTQDHVVYDTAKRTAPDYISMADGDKLDIQIPPKQRFIYVFTIDGSGGALNVIYTTNNRE
jgi:hypothetical protein